MKFENSVVIAQPVDRVFKFVTDLKNNKKWQTDILELEITSDGCLGIGSKYRCVNRFMGKRLETKGVVTDYVPEKNCSIRITNGSVRGVNSFLFEVVDGGTKVTAVGELDMGYFKVAKMLINRKVRQQLKNDMLKLKHILENDYSSQETPELECSSGVG
jgi:uncharacterized membrane protein